jgi:hypothetical protein
MNERDSPFRIGRVRGGPRPCLGYATLPLAVVSAGRARAARHLWAAPLTTRTPPFADGVSEGAYGEQ